MPINNTSNDIVHYQQHIFFLLNTPNRMYGELIEEVNSAMHEVIPDLKRFAEDILGYSIKFCRMDFGHSPQWMECADILDYVWLDVWSTGGNALGGAYHLLNSALSRQEGGFMQLCHNCAPIIILLLGATPSDDVESGLEVLKKNKWFQHSIKIAIEVDYNPHPYFHKYLLDFTMDENAIIHADETNLRIILKDIMTRSVMSVTWPVPINCENYIRDAIIGKPQTYTDIIEHKVPVLNELTDDF